MSLPIVPRGPIDNLELFMRFSAEVPVFSLDRPLDPHPDLPDTVVHRFNHTVHQMQMPDGKMIEVWGFTATDPNDPYNKANWVQSFPSPMIRMTEGDLFHGISEHHPEDPDEPEDDEDDRQHQDGHSIHWHGIEPTSANDGVPKESFGIRHPRDHNEAHEGRYTYQWRASEAGTYFYHCHRNTVLHFEMGMYGPLVIDPPAPAGSALQPPYPDGGPGYVRYRDTVERYDVERYWVADDFDSRWHTLHEDAGLPDGTLFNERANPQLNVFQPDYFLISGVPAPWTETDPGIVAHMKVGETLLLRILCASYLIETWTLGLPAEVIAYDGRALGYRKGRPVAYSQPFHLAAGQSFDLSTARRMELLVRPTQAGTFPVVVKFRDMNVHKTAVVGECRTSIVVT